MNNRQKWVICLLAAAMLVALFLSAQAAATGKNGLFNYEMKGNGTLRITDFDWSNYTNNSDSVIPQMIDGYTVTEIGELALSQGDMDYEKIELPERRKEAKNASLIIPNTVTAIGEKAFFNSGIGRVSIPASVKSIGTAAFCTGELKNATIDMNNERYAVIDSSLYDKQSRELLALATDTSSVPEGIVSLGEYSCININDNKVFTFPTTLENIKDYAFLKSKLYADTTFDFSNLITIGKYAFADVTIYTDLKFTSALKEIGEGAFYKSSCVPYSLPHVEFSECTQLTVIPSRCFESASIYRFKLPSTIVEIQSRAFYESNYPFGGRRDSFGYEGWPYGIRLKIIGDFAFYNAGLIDQVVIEDIYLSEVEYIGVQALRGVYIYAEQTIPECCTFIGEEAFYKKTKLLVKPGSYAESWAQENGYNYDNGIEQNLDWLNGV